jgi:hypothetical protein
MQKRRIGWIGLLCVLMVTSILGCSSDGSSTEEQIDGDGISDGDLPPDGDQTDGDLPQDGDFPEDGDINVDGDDGPSANGDEQLRGYFCEQDRDCAPGESCLPFSDASARICLPENFIRFTDDQTFIIDTSSLSPVIEQNEEGEDLLVAKGLVSLSEPGNPDLPSLTFNVLLPPDADLSAVELQILSDEKSEMLGSYSIAPAGPANWRPELSDSETFEDYLDQRPYIVDGYNTSIYETNAFWPADPIRIQATSQMRKWKFARIQIFPFAFNPSSGKIKRTSYLRVHVTAPALSLKSGLAIAKQRLLLADNSFDSVAQNLFANIAELSSRYNQPLAPPDDNVSKSDYVILTTSDVVSRSQALAEFVAHKKAIGFRVLVVTEDDYGVLEGVDSAEKARNWLKAEYARRGIQYLLILADPNPNELGPFMRICWPRYNKEQKKDDYEKTATDAYYADLTGNWDKDGDGIWCEYGSGNGDTGTGGVDLTPELYVGRIPVYGQDIGKLDDILRTTIAYESQKDIDWRYSVMLPAPISDFSHEIDHGEDVNRGFTVDGAKFAEKMKRDFLNSSNNMSTYSLYDTRGPEASKFSPDKPFSEQNVCEAWAVGHGITSWWAHGNSASAAAKTWIDDKNGNKIADADEKDWEDFAHNGMPASCFNQERRTFTSQVSCLNHRPDRNNNLGHYLLYKGGAITTMGATSVTLYSPSWSSPNTHRMDNVSFGYYYTELLAKNFSAGRALAMVRSKPCSFSWGDGTLMNMVSFNVYGDPSVSIFTTYQTGAETQSASFDDNGHAFNKAVSGVEGLQLSWDLYYAAEPGDQPAELKVEVNLFDTQETPIELDEALAHRYELKNDALIFDGDRPDRFSLAYSELVALGSGTQSLRYRITATLAVGDEEPQVVFSGQMTAFEIVLEPEQSVEVLELDVLKPGELTQSVSSRLFVLTLPQAGRLNVTLDGPASGADFDLYVRKGEAPTRTEYEGRGYTASADEQVIIEEAELGEYFIMVDGYSGTGEFSVLATLTTEDDVDPQPDVTPLPVDEVVTGELAVGESRIYSLEIAASGNLVVLAEGSEGSRILLYAKRGEIPSPESFDASATEEGNYQEMQSEVQAGDWYIMIVAGNVATHYELIGWLE